MSEAPTDVTDGPVWRRSPNLDKKTLEGHSQTIESEIVESASYNFKIYMFKTTVGNMKQLRPLLAKLLQPEPEMIKWLIDIAFHHANSLEMTFMGLERLLKQCLPSFKFMMLAGSTRCPWWDKVFLKILHRNTDVWENNHEFTGNRSFTTKYRSQIWHFIKWQV